jgi:hypothetical protein
MFCDGTDDSAAVPGGQKYGLLGMLSQQDDATKLTG